MSLKKRREGRDRTKSTIRSIRSSKLPNKNISPSSRQLNTLITSYLFPQPLEVEREIRSTLRKIDSVCQNGEITYEKMFLIALIQIRKRNSNSSSVEDITLQRLHYLYNMIPMDQIARKDNRFRKMVLGTLIVPETSKELWRSVFTDLRQSMEADDYMFAATRAILHNKFDIFTDIIRDNSSFVLDIDKRVTLISQAYYATKHRFCEELIKNISETDLIIVRSQIPDIDLNPTNLNGGRDRSNSHETINPFAVKDGIELKTAYTIQRSLGTIVDDPALVYDVFINSLGFDDLNFSRHVYADAKRYIKSHLQELYEDLIDSNDMVRLRNLMKLDYESLQLSTLFDFKETRILSNIQSKSLHRAVIDISIDRGHIDNLWLRKFYRFYRRAIDRSCPEKIVILSYYLNIVNENQIMAIEERIKRGELSLGTYNSRILYQMLRQTDPFISRELIHYFVNTRKLDRTVYGGILVRTAVRYGRGDILYLLS